MGSLHRVVIRHPSADELEAHLRSRWGFPRKRSRVNARPMEDLPEEFAVAIFAPRDRGELWKYATLRMSTHDGPLELFLYSHYEDDSHVELLTAIAHYHVTGERLDVGHTVQFGRPWQPGSRCDAGLISLPYAEGPELEIVAASSVRYAWLIPITQDERRYKMEHGIEALEQAFEQQGLQCAVQWSENQAHGDTGERSDSRGREDLRITHGHASLLEYGVSCAR